MRHNIRSFFRKLSNLLSQVPYYLQARKRKGFTTIPFPIVSSKGLRQWNDGKSNAWRWEEDRGFIWVNLLNKDFKCLSHNRLIDFYTDLLTEDSRLL